MRYISHPIETTLWNWRCASAEMEFDPGNLNKIKAVSTTYQKHRQTVRDSLRVVEGTKRVKESIVNIFHNHSLNNWGYPNCLDNLI